MEFQLLHGRLKFNFALLLHSNSGLAHLFDLPLQIRLHCLLCSHDSSKSTMVRDLVVSVKEEEELSLVIAAPMQGFLLVSRAGKSLVSRSRTVGGRRFQAFTGGVDMVIVLGIMLASFLA
jgi:hypothetical protein